MAKAKGSVCWGLRFGVQALSGSSSLQKDPLQEGMPTIEDEMLRAETSKHFSYLRLSSGCAKCKRGLKLHPAGSKSALARHAASEIKSEGFGMP